MPQDVREFEITPLFAPFDITPKILILYGKGQAMVELPSISSAGVVTLWRHPSKRKQI
jgi:hypothetical protein